jgi:hypothetical protein
MFVEDPNVYIITRGIHTYDGYEYFRIKPINRDNTLCFRHLASEANLERWRLYKCPQ